MLLSNIRKGLLVFLSLLVASAAIAAPTVSDCNRNLVAVVLSLSADADSACAYEINQIGEPTNSPIASVAAEFLKPPAAADQQVSSISVKSLPPVPGALFLGLAGFLCVSLVKDRRVWFTALAGLFWLGQTGFAALPQLASHLRSKKQIQQSSPNLIYVSELEGSYRLRSDLEGTQYIGLLRHLAGIPDVTMLLPSSVFPLSLRIRHYVRRIWQSQLPKEARLPSVIPAQLVPSEVEGAGIHSPSDRSTFSQREDRFRPPHFTTGVLVLHLIRTSFCSALKNKQLFPFSTSFISGHLARSPP
jgi:hypothetical protein